MNARSLVVCLVVVAVSACAPGRGDVRESSGPGRLLAGTFRRHIDHDGRRRSYIVHVPPQAAGEKPLPLVLNFHGGGGNAAGHREYTGLDRLADEEGFLVVYPDGTGRFGTLLLTWNAGACCGFSMEHGIDDVGFVRALIADLATVAPIDGERIYATGLSNGAMMAYRLAAEAADLVAAIAPVGGAARFTPLEPARPVPILHIHSVDDPRALYDGGLGPPFPLTINRIEHVPVEAVLADWAAINGCEQTPIPIESRQTESREGATHGATLFVYPGCAAEVALWKLTGAGHVWPGGTPAYLEQVLGPSTDVIDANRELWEFFEKFALPEPAGLELAADGSGPGAGL